MEDYSDPESMEAKSDQLPRHLSEKLRDNHSISSSSANKQGSIFSLTLDEFQHKSGKSFGSMNMDELLSNVWNNNADGNLVIPSHSIFQNEASYDEINGARSMEINDLHRQGSFSPAALCKKTVEEVWAEINRNQSSPTDHQNPSISSNGLSEREHTFGEITLEDFLIKVGVIQEPCTPLPELPPPQAQAMVDCLLNSTCGRGNLQLTTHAGLGPDMGPRPVMGLGLISHPNPSNANNFRGNGSQMYQVFAPSGSCFVGEYSSNDDINVNENEKCHGAGREEPQMKRTTNGSFELAVERRQRRMIKNRESAARSRARKQAYTAELEIELNQLREENTRLKNVMAEAENKRKLEVLKGKLLTKVQRTEERIKTMRRTTSSVL